MKKLISLFICVVLGMTLIAQERTVTKTMKTGVYYYSYTGTSSDELVKTTRDTIDFLFVYQSPEFVKKISLLVEMDTGSVAAADGEYVTFSLFGKEFSSDSCTYTQIIAAANSDVVDSNDEIFTTQVDNYTTIASYTVATLLDTTEVWPYDGAASAIDSVLYTGTNTVAAQTITPFDMSYRVYRLRAILQSSASATEGTKIAKIEFKLYTD